MPRSSGTYTWIGACSFPALHLVPVYLIGVVVVISWCHFSQAFRIWSDWGSASSSSCGYGGRDRRVTDGAANILPTHWNIRPHSPLSSWPLCRETTTLPRRAWVSLLYTGYGKFLNFPYLHRRYTGSLWTNSMGGTGYVLPFWTHLTPTTGMSPKIGTSPSSLPQNATIQAIRSHSVATATSTPKKFTTQPWSSTWSFDSPGSSSSPPA